MRFKISMLAGFKEVAVLSLALSFTALINMNVVLPGYIASLGGNVALIGLAYSLRSFVRCFARLFSGIYSQRIGGRRSIIIGLLIKASAFYLIFSAENIIMVVVGILVLSISEGFIEPTFLSSTADMVGELGAIGTAFGVAFTIRRAPSVIAPIFTGYVADSWDVRQVFLIAILFSLLGVPLSLKVKFKEKCELNGKYTFKMIGSIMNRPFIMLLIAVTTLSTAFSAYNPYLSYWVTNELKYGYASLGMILTAGSIIGIFSRIYIGYISDRIGHINTLTLVGAVRAIATSTLTLASDPLSITISYALRSSVMAAPSRNALISTLCERRYLNMAYSLVGIFMDVGRIIGPTLVGSIISLYGFTYGFAAIAILYTIFIFTLIILKMTLKGRGGDR